MVLPLFSWQRYSHIAVEEKDDIPMEPTASTITKHRTHLLCFLCFGLIFSAGYVLRIAQTSKTRSDIFLDPIAIAFESNRSFLERPSEQSNILWSSLYPQKMDSSTIPM